MIRSASRPRAFTGPLAEQKAERVGFWFKALAGDVGARAWCVKEGIGLTKATGEGSDTIGGFLAPQDFDTAIINVRETMGAFRRGAEVRPSRSDNQVRPRRSGALTANFVQDGAAIPESSLTLDAVETSMKKMAILARASTELFEDAAPDLGELLASEIGYAFATKEDDCGFNGDGTSTVWGIAGLSLKLTGAKGAVGAAAGHNTFLQIDTTDLGNVMGGVLATAVPNAAWYCSAQAYAQTFCRLAGSGGGGYMETRLVDGVPTPFYLGHPILFSGKLANGDTSMVGKPMVFFGDLAKSSVIVERTQQTVIAISTHRALDTDQVLIRGTRRLDIVNHSTGDATTRGSVAMLTGTA